MLNATRLYVKLRLRRAAMKLDSSPVVVSIDDVVENEELALSIDVPTEEDDSESFETIVVEFQTH